VNGLTDGRRIASYQMLKPQNNHNANLLKIKEVLKRRTPHEKMNIQHRTSSVQHPIQGFRPVFDKG